MSELRRLWAKSDEGTATAQDLIDAVWLTGELQEASYLPRVWRLADADHHLVRYYALQALVLGLEVKNDEAVELCWRLLESDPSEDVKAMAITCLSSIFFGSGRLDVFARLKELLRSRTASRYLKDRAYNGLFRVAGRPPEEWPELSGSPEPADEASIDWLKVTELEDLTRRAAADNAD